MSLWLLLPLSISLAGEGVAQAPPPPPAPTLMGAAAAGLAELDPLPAVTREIRALLVRLSRDTAFASQVAQLMENDNRPALGALFKRDAPLSSLTIVLVTATHLVVRFSQPPRSGDLCLGARRECGGQLVSWSAR